MNEELYYDIDKIVYVDTSNGGHWTYTVRDFLNLLAKGKVVTCVYCGQEYPPGTPTSQSELLTEHIKICPKHPMNALKLKYENLLKCVVHINRSIPMSYREDIKLELKDIAVQTVYLDIYGKEYKDD